MWNTNVKKIPITNIQMMHHLKVMMYDAGNDSKDETDDDDDNKDGPQHSDSMSATPFARRPSSAPPCRPVRHTRSSLLQGRLASYVRCSWLFQNASTCFLLTHTPASELRYSLIASCSHAVDRSMTMPSRRQDKGNAELRKADSICEIKEVRVSPSPR